MSALLLKRWHSKPIERGKWVNKNLVTTCLSVFITLLTLQACSDHKENRARVYSKNRPNSAKEEIVTWKKLIGKTYRVESRQPVALRFLPNSTDRIELGEGEEFTVKDLLVDEADHRNSHYAVGLSHGGRVYIRAYELRELIETQRVAEAETAARGSTTAKKNYSGNASDDRSSTPKNQALRWSVSRPGTLITGYPSTKFHGSWRFADLITEEWDSQSVAALMIMAAGAFSLAWILWQVMGVKKTFCFLAILCLGYWQFSTGIGRDPEWGLLMIGLALGILLVNLLGIRNFVRFMIGLVNSLILLYLVKSVYQHIDSLVAVILVSVCAAGIAASLFFLLLRATTYRGEGRMPEE